MCLEAVKKFCLDYRDRPPEVKEQVDKAFEIIADAGRSSWGLYNGREEKEYRLANISECSLLQKIISDSPERKEFYLLDVGAGDYGWCRGVAKFINARCGLSDEITVHIIGVGAEGRGFLGDSVITEGSCHIHCFRSFKVEEISDEMRTRMSDLLGRVDLIVSQWCMIHLVDPVGTFVQLYSFLRPGGFLLTNGFCASLEAESSEEDAPYVSYLHAVTQIFLDTKSPFLFWGKDLEPSRREYVLRKEGSDPCRLPLKYSGVRSDFSHHFVGSECLTFFLRLAPITYVPQYRRDDDESTLAGKETDYYGDEQLFLWLTENNLIKDGFAGKATFLPIPQRS